MPSSSLHDLVAGAMIALAAEASEQVPAVQLTREQQEDLADHLTGSIAHTIMIYMDGIKIGLNRADEINRYGV